MDVQKLLRNPRFRLERNPAPDPIQLKQFQEHAPRNLPRTYVRFLEACDCARGKIPYDTGYIEFFSVESALDQNRKHHVTESLPGFFAFGCDGADELYVFDLRSEDGAPVCCVSAKAASVASVSRITNSFSEFLEGIVLMGGAT
ncbi:MAG TPA: SMI1/KNR4 family protein [Myxococcota bacterium]|nr:SMI1/KNR4 family protein [Myxococcota bacterium]